MWTDQTVRRKGVVDLYNWFLTPCQPPRSHELFWHWVFSWSIAHLLGDTGFSMAGSFDTQAFTVRVGRIATRLNRHLATWSSTMGLSVQTISVSLFYCDSLQLHTLHVKTVNFRKKPRSLDQKSGFLSCSSAENVPKFHRNRDTVLE